MADRSVARLVGIDLGTTHTIVAWADAERGGEPEVFAIPQLVAPSEVEARPLLPSVLYAPVAGEAAVDPFGDAPYVAGELARRRGAEVPGRTIASAKSWLCHAGVDRTAAILPWGAEDDVPKTSPVDASARVLAHVRATWDAAFPDAKLASQEVVLTVPASFDEAARELTVLAARSVGLAVRLLEEPQAAFYDAMARLGGAGLDALLARTGGGSALVLVCDVGGGTTDLSLIRVARDPGPAPPATAPSETGKIHVTRVAVGSHLLLGGDNMDLALAAHCEASLGEKLDAARFAQLVTAARDAKERLLGADAPESARITVLARGSRLVGGARSWDVARADAERIVLDGFFPDVPATARPERARAALVAFGLPYERDPAITKHVAWFLARHARRDGGREAEGEPVRAVLFNGGVFRAPRVVDRLASVLGRWSGAAVDVVPQPDPDLAVARGAVAYAMALRGRGVRIEGGAARGYYVALGAGDDGRRRAVSVIPRGAKEGERQVVFGRTFALTVGRPARFDLYASDDARVDPPGAVVVVDEDRFQALPPVAVAFEGRSGGEIEVRLEGELSAIGTLDLACVEARAAKGADAEGGAKGADAEGGAKGADAEGGARRFRLAFQLRGAGADAADPPGAGRASGAPRADVTHAAATRDARSSGAPAPSGKRVDEALDAIDRVFGKPRPGSPAREAKDLVRELERLLGERAEWTTPLARRLADAILPLRSARRRTLDHERAFWMLTGFCLRPGFGDPSDPPRVRALAPLFQDRLAFPEGPRAWQPFFVAWRRVAAGLDEAQQTAIRDVLDPFLAPPEAGLKRPKKAKIDALDDALDLAASLERIPPARRAELGAWVLERTWTDRDPRLWAALGKLGARAPAYASVHHAVAPHVVERWLDHLLREKWDAVPTAPRAAVQLARVTGDRARDVGDRVRRDVAKRLEAVGARPEWVRAVRELVEASEEDRAAFYGEALPPGLRLVS